MATRQTKSANYFSHDSNARNDEKLVRLRMKHSAAGYGVYFMILERLRDNTEYMSAKDYNMIAFDLRVDAALVKSVVEDFGLFVFTSDGKYFYSDSFKRRMDIKESLSRKRSECAKKAVSERWNKKKTNPPTPKATPIASEQSTDNTSSYLTRFFRKENNANIEVVLMNLGLQPTDLPKLKKLANEVVAEWKATDKQHSNYTDWSQHLIATIRIKMKSSHGNSAINDTTPPTSSDYQFDGGFDSKDV